MLKIGDFSRLSRISIKMLRHYDEIGLLAPQTTDEFTGYRYYGEAQLPMAGRIVALRDMGFGLAAIGEIIHSYDDPQALAQFLAVRRAEIQAEANDTARRLLLLETAIKRLGKDGTMHYDVTLKTIPERYIASVRGTIAAYDKEGELWELLYRETGPQHMQCAENSMGLAVFHDEGYKESNVDVEIQVTVKGTYHNTEHVTFQTAPAVTVASATYKGSYASLTEANGAVANWVRDNGYQFAGPSFCIYHVSPAQTQNPDELVTEVCHPVQKK